MINNWYRRHRGDVIWVAVAVTIGFVCEVFVFHWLTVFS